MLAALEAPRLNPAGDPPIPLTALFGRDADLARLSEALATARLLTLTGPAGVGKTRLAVELAAAARSGTDRPAVFVRLASLPAGAPVSPPVAEALAVEPPARRTLEAAIVEAVRDRDLLLFLDNCEHVVDDCARLCELVLASCPGVRIVATSREALGVPGERLHAVAPLEVPERDATGPGAVRRSPAVRLFLDRAALVSPSLALDAGTAPTVAAICRRLEGIPLALELAAARASMMPPEEILARLDSRLDLLTEGPRTAADRQRTLRGTIDWSYELLTDSERALFRRLAVFSGSFDLTAAEAVSGGGPVAPGGVLSLLTRLVAKSLVVPEPPVAGRARYRLLEMLREYGLERLEDNRETAAIRDAHARHYLDVAEAGAPPGLFDRDVRPTAWFEAIAADRENVSSALAWFRVADPPALARLVAAAGSFWSLRGLHAEARPWVAAALAAEPEPGELRGRLLMLAGMLAWRAGDFGVARGRLEEAVAIAREHLDRESLGMALGRLGFVLFGSDDHTAAGAIFEEQMGIARETGSAALLLDALHNRAILATHLDDREAARQALEEVLQRTEAGDDGYRTIAQGLLGRLHVRLGNLPAARALLAEALTGRVRRNDRLSIGGAIDYLVELEAAAGELERAAVLVGVSDRLYAEAEARPASLPGESRERAWKRAHDRLGARATRLRREGAALPDATAFAFALSRDAAPPVAAGRPEELTGRELQVATLVAQGLTNRQVASALGLSPRTVDAHLEHARDKLGINSRAQLAAWVARRQEAGGPGPG